METDEMEFFDIVDENDKVIGNISENMQNTVKPAQLRFINIIITNNDDKIIVPKRSATKRLFPNCYDFSVGGHVNSGEDYEEAAYRELKEELGIDIDVKLSQPSKAAPYIFVKAFPRLTGVIPLQPRNALCQMTVTELGMVNDLTPVQPSNASTPIEVTE